MFSTHDSRAPAAVQVVGRPRDDPVCQKLTSPGGFECCHASQQHILAPCDQSRIGRPLCPWAFNLTAQPELEARLDMPKFNYGLDFKTINFREHPELYQVGKGEQGVLSVEPYKSELLPHWKFKDPDCATSSSETLFNKFQDYKNSNDFVGMDMARKFLQVNCS